MDGRAGGTVPEHRGLALVGDGQRTKLPRLQTGALQGLACHSQLAAPDLVGIVLNPAGLRKVLGKLLLRQGHDPALAVKHERTRTGGALVEGKDVFHGLAGYRKLRQSTPGFHLGRPRNNT